MLKLDQVDEYCEVLESQGKDEEFAEKLYQKFKEDLKTHEYTCYGLLFSLLHDLQQNSQKNKMTSETLSIVFVPLIIQQKKSKNPKDFLKHLLKGKTLLVFVIQNYKVIFDSELIDAQYHKYITLAKESGLNSEVISSTNSSRSNSLLGMFKKSSFAKNNSSQDSLSTNSSHGTLYIKFDPKTTKYDSIWKQNMFFIKFDEKKVGVLSSI